MKIHDFGLWFRTASLDWSTSIPKKSNYRIFYDGAWIGTKFIAQAHIIKMKDPRFTNDFDEYIALGRSLSLDDFEIIPNPDYQEQK